MKRLPVILLVLFYLFTTAGIAVNIHYCADSNRTFFALYSDTGDCCCEDEEAASSCCEDQVIFIKIEQPQQAKYEVKTPANPKIANGLPARVLNSHDNDLPYNLLIPDKTFLPSQIPIWLKHCSLVFYG